MMMTRNRALERPSWSRQGTLEQKHSLRHYIPKHPFYYTTTELATAPDKLLQESRAKTTKKYVSGLRDSDTRRAYSALEGSRSRSSKLPPLSEKRKVSPPVRERYALVRPDSVPWVSTPVPGARTIPAYDLYRRVALDEKDDLYHIDSGLLPKYMGYVPGLKFRYGATFGNLTFNAKEIGVEQSATWGGAVSLF